MSNDIIKRIAQDNFSNKLIDVLKINCGKGKEHVLFLSV